MSQPDDPGCSPCPMLDLGKRYPTGDERDPWRRMPLLFGAARKTFGGGFCNHNGRTRVGTEKLMRRYCELQRSRYGLCTRRRSGHCQRLLLGALQGAQEGQSPHALLNHLLVQVVNAEETHELMKGSIARPTDVAALPELDFDFGSQQQVLAA